MGVLARYGPAIGAILGTVCGGIAINQAVTAGGASIPGLPQQHPNDQGLRRFHNRCALASIPPDAGPSRRHPTPTRSTARPIPDSADAVFVLDGLVGAYGRTFDAVDSAKYRTALPHLLVLAKDARAERYFQLLGTINEWPVQPGLAPIFDWFTRAIQAHPNP